MVLAQRLEFRQSQSLVMTPQLQQAIKLLQLSNIELAEFVENELEQNPLLERDEGLGPVESSANSDEPPTVESIERMDSHDVAMSGQLSPAGEAPLDTEYDNVWESGSLSDEAGTAAGDGETLGSYGSSSGGDYENYDATERLVGEETLRDHLVAQIGIDLSDPQERLIGLALVDLLDECGYLTGDLASLGEQLGCPPGAGEAGAGQGSALRSGGGFCALPSRNASACNLPSVTALTPVCKRFWIILICWLPATYRRCCASAGLIRPIWPT